MQQNQNEKLIMRVTALHETMCKYQVSLLAQFLTRLSELVQYDTCNSLYLEITLSAHC